MKDTQYRAAWSVTLLISFLSLSAVSISKAANGDDWKFFGTHKKNSDFARPVDFFYLANQIHHLSNGNPLVWTEAVDVQAIYSHLKEDALDRADKKVENDYIPPYIKLNIPNSKRASDRKRDAEALALVVMAEEIADETLVDADFKTLVQLDCANQRYRIMSTPWALCTVCRSTRVSRLIGNM
jgi:hypothetical protein